MNHMNPSPLNNATTTGDGAGCRWRKTLIAGSLIALFSPPVLAFTFDLENGVTGAWNTNVSIGTSWRTQGPDSRLISVGNASEVPGASGADSNSDDGNLNFKKGDRFSTVLKVVSDAEFKYQNYGGVIRATAWNDFTLADKGVPHGHVPNGYVPGAKLDDSGFFGRNKFSNIALLDLFGYTNLELGGGNKLNLRLGRQVVNWGESLFVPGMNSFGTVDVSAVRRPGAEVKEILLPYNQAVASLGFAGGPTIEAFYQIKWERTFIDPCGTFFGPDPGFDYSCNKLTATAPGLPDGTALAIGATVPRDEIRPKNEGQYGIALRYRAESIDTDFGLYYANYHARTPFISVGTPTVAPAPSLFRAEFPEDLRSVGFSASTLIGTWSVAGEIHHVSNMPVQINVADIVFGSFGLGGPMVSLATLPPGTLVRGYDRIGMTQAQVNWIKVFPNLVGPNSAFAFVGEVVYIHANLPSEHRYGRAGPFGFATQGTTTVFGGACNVPAVNNEEGCANGGFATNNSWGYRILGEFTFQGVAPGLTLKPRAFLAHDVSGYSPDGTFLKDRKNLGLALHADYKAKYSAEISYTHGLSTAKFDPFRDRDFIAVSMGVSF